jgi:hypothetical protein
MLAMDELATLFWLKQGDRIGIGIFARWVIVYFGRFFF